MRVAGLQGIEGYTVVQDRLDARLFRNKLDNPLAQYFLSFKNSHLRFKGDLAHWVIETTDFEFAGLKTESISIARSKKVPLQ